MTHSLTLSLLLLLSFFLLISAFLFFPLYLCLSLHTDKHTKQREKDKETTMAVSTKWVGLCLVLLLVLLVGTMASVRKD